MSKPREFWIGEPPVKGMPFTVSEINPTKYAHQYIHVIEVRDGNCEHRTTRYYSINNGERFREKYRICERCDTRLDLD